MKINSSLPNSWQNLWILLKPYEFVIYCQYFHSHSDLPSSHKNNQLGSDYCIIFWSTDPNSKKIGKKEEIKPGDEVHYFNSNNQETETGGSL